MCLVAPMHNHDFTRKRHIQQAGVTCLADWCSALGQINLGYAGQLRLQALQKLQADRGNNGAGSNPTSPREIPQDTQRRMVMWRSDALAMLQIGLHFVDVGERQPPTPGRSPPPEGVAARMRLMLKLCLGYALRHLCASHLVFCNAHAFLRQTCLVF